MKLAIILAIISLCSAAETDNSVELKDVETKEKRQVLVPGALGYGGYPYGMGMGMGMGMGLSPYGVPLGVGALPGVILRKRREVPTDNGNEEPTPIETEMETREKRQLMMPGYGLGFGRGLGYGTMGMGGLGMGMMGAGYPGAIGLGYPGMIFRKRRQVSPTTVETTTIVPVSVAPTSASIPADLVSTPATLISTPNLPVSTNETTSNETTTTMVPVLNPDEESTTRAEPDPINYGGLYAAGIFPGVHILPIEALLNPEEVAADPTSEPTSDGAMKLAAVTLVQVILPVFALLF